MKCGMYLYGLWKNTLSACPAFYQTHRVLDQTAQYGVYFALTVPMLTLQYKRSCLIPSQAIVLSRLVLLALPASSFSDSHQSHCPMFLKWRSCGSIWGSSAHIAVATALFPVQPLTPSPTSTYTRYTWEAPLRWGLSLLPILSDLGNQTSSHHHSPIPSFALAHPWLCVSGAP